MIVTFVIVRVCRSCHTYWIFQRKTKTKKRDLKSTHLTACGGKQVLQQLHNKYSNYMISTVLLITTNTLPPQIFQYLMTLANTTLILLILSDRQQMHKHTYNNMY